jgi:hypothetical protein
MMYGIGLLNDVQVSAQEGWVNPMSFNKQHPYILTTNVNRLPLCVFICISLGKPCSKNSRQSFTNVGNAPVPT